MANMQMNKTPMKEQDPNVRNANFLEVALGYTLDEAVNEAKRCIHCKNPACVTGCPVGIPIPDFLAKVAEGDIAAAYEILSNANALPAISGRVCPQENQCEGKCVRGIKGEPVAIGRVERFVADWAAEHGVSNLATAPANGHKVAVIGSGPAGLTCAGELARMGVRLIALRCAGFNNVDLKAAAEHGITVVRVPAYSPYAVAEHAVALMLSLNRKIPRASWRTRDGNFSLHGLLGFDMHGKTAGIIGTGKIAKILIHILKGFGMNILAYDLYPDYNFARENQIVYTTLDELYHSSDIISLHCPLTEQTKYLINDYSISKMKDGVMIINTGRGQLIHTNALIEGLKNKKIGSAGLDVYEEESEYFYEDKSDRIIDDDVLARLLSFNNVIVTSHQAFFTREALANIAATTLENIRDFKNQKPLVNEVKLSNA